MALAAVVAGQRAVVTDVNQFFNILKGVTGSGESVTLIYNNTGALIFQPSSDPAGGTQLVQIKNNAGTVQLALTSDGILVMTAAASKLVPGVTSFAVRNNADSQNNIIVTDAGAVTLRALLTNTVANPSISLGADGSASGGLRIWNASAASREGNVYGDATYSIRMDTNSNARPIRIDGSQFEVGSGKEINVGTLTAGGNAANFYQIGTSGPLVYSGSGAPSISAAVKGSLYLRTDGSSTSTRAYIATDAAGAWTAITTAA